MVEVIANVTFDATFTPPAPNSIFYYKQDLDILKQRPGIIAGRQMPVGEVKFPYNITINTLGIIGLDAAGNAIASNSDLIVLPCPPYCNNDYTELTFQEALAYLSAP